MTNSFYNPDRAVLRIAGADRVSFLEGLVSNSVARVEQGPVYAAMLSPQGKYLFDFIMSSGKDSILLDIRKNRAATLAQRLTMYRLRADVEITETDLAVLQGFEAAPEDAFTDPRNDALGWRMYGDGSGLPELDSAAWDALRVAHEIPETGVELLPDDSYILETGFERLNGVDFRKGCYVGQEVTARMKHKTELKKGLVSVSVDGEAEAGTAITTDGKPAGTLHTVSGGQGLAYLRFDRAKGDMQAEGAVIRRN
ncbi:folate-binding protein YgfZ [Rhodobacterales bacterium 52_120_T64]|nr:folate-binding protein YgfZ [Rhodobacterales bacterium 52_120_T64]